MPDPDPDPRRDARALRGWSRAAAGLNLAGVAAAALLMRPGAPSTGTLEVRRAFLAARPPGWPVGWAVWALAALATVALFVALARRLGGRAGPLALVLVAMAAAVDLLCDALQALVLPQVAAEVPALFGVLERALWVEGVVVASGLYCLGVGVATLGLARRGRARAALVVTGAATVLGGAVWAAAEVALARDLLEPVTGLTVGAYVAWTLLLPGALEPRAS